MGIDPKKTATKENELVTIWLTRSLEVSFQIFDCMLVFQFKIYHELSSVQFAKMGRQNYWTKCMS
jgi:hypothetical protein